DYSTTGGSSLHLQATATLSTYFMGILSSSYSTLNVQADSTTKWGSSRLRVALVLDNTGSMAQDGKLTGLKTATKNLLDQLKAAVSVDGDVYVSIIPFSKDVRVDMSDYTTDWDTWIGWDDGTDNSWDGSHGTCSTGNSSDSPRSKCLSKSSCSISGYTSQSSCTSAGTCSLSSYTTQNSCTGAGTCSLSSYTTQNSCTGAGTCSDSQYTTQSMCTATGTCSLSGHSTQTSCQNAGTCSNPGQTSQSSCTGSKACSNSTYTSKSNCQNHGYTWGFGTWTHGVWTAKVPSTWTAGVWTPGVWTWGVWGTATWTHDAHTTWSGCITDRGSSWTSGPGTSAGYDQDVTAPSSSVAGTMYPAEDYSLCTQPVIGLNYDWDSMKTMVDNMAANGSTNQPIGLVWGWLSLAGGGGPFTVPAMDSDYTYNQVIILLSDGLNTQDRWYGNGMATSTSVDNRMRTSSGAGTCANIKAAGITIYTIQVNTGSPGDPTSTLLQNCASNTTGTTDHFYELKNANDIVTTFQKIGTNLTKLHVAN
ncbi:MAG TPA: vWA domain-containing protein, partial [Bradyrhizobium sp.]|nr:vWA domain-containing protein [Bradyrhizobium sp.]